MQTGDTNYTNKNELDKACFQHDMAYQKCKGLENGTQLDKVLKTKLLQLETIYKIFDKKSKGAGIKSMPNQQLCNEFHKPIIRKLI